MRLARKSLLIKDCETMSEHTRTATRGTRRFSCTWAMTRSMPRAVDQGEACAEVPSKIAVRGPPAALSLSSGSAHGGADDTIDIVCAVFSHGVATNLVSPRLLAPRCRRRSARLRRLRLGLPRSLCVEDVISSASRQAAHPRRYVVTVARHATRLASTISGESSSFAASFCGQLSMSMRTDR